MFATHRRWALLLALSLVPASLLNAADALPVANWAAMVDGAKNGPGLAAARDSLLAEAKKAAVQPIVQRAHEYEDIGKHRTWLDGRARAMAGMSRQKWFGLSMSDFGACATIERELPLLAVAYRWSGDEALKVRIIAQLEEMATWSPLQRPGYTLYMPSSDPVPADFNDGNWLATGLGVRALADTLEIMPPGSLPRPLVQNIHALLRREIASIADDWRTKRSWFIRSNYPQTNQWVLPTEGLVRACLTLGKEQYPAEYELGVNNLLAALNVQGPNGEFCEGIGYARFTVESMLHAVHAMAVVGDTRGMDHPFLRRFPTWMVEHLQPGRFRINCFDSGPARVAVDDDDFRGVLSLFVMLTNDPVARWALGSQFSGPSDDFLGLLARTRTGESRDPGCLASYEIACRVNWRSSWSDDATGAWIRGGNAMDSHDHFDRGHVNFILRGKPILIEAGTPSYDNPRLETLYQSVVGHNVLEIVGSDAKKMPTPITVVRLDGEGGEVAVDPTAGYPDLKQWQRRVTWTADRLDVEDEVVFPEGKFGSPILRWHLGTQDEVRVETAGTQTTVVWADAKMILESPSPFVVTAEMLPDNTVNLGKKDGPDYWHRCLVIRPAQPGNAWTLHTLLLSPGS